MAKLNCLPSSFGAGKGSIFRGGDKAKINHIVNWIFKNICHK